MVKRFGEKKRLNIYLPESLYKRISEDADHLGITKSAMAQIAIINYYAPSIRGSNPRCLMSSRKPLEIRVSAFLIPRNTKNSRKCFLPR